MIFMRTRRVPALLAVGLLALLAACGGDEVTGPTEITSTDVTVGTGATAVVGDVVTLHYNLTVNGNKIDSSYDRGTPITFQLGVGATIPGFEMGVLGMKVGGKRQVVVPPALGYGNQPPAGSGIPSNATLNFDIELLAIAGK
jgi:FKBP-type peptidyl-prolyl cis-trans isomerase